MMEGKIYIERLYPYDKAGTISLIRGYGILLEEEYLPEGIRVKSLCTEGYLSEGIEVWQAGLKRQYIPLSAVQRRKMEWTEHK